MSCSKSKTDDLKNIYFADLFAGIGGFHHAFTKSIKKNNDSQISASCKLVCEIDKFAKELYSKQFKYDLSKILDISAVDPKSHMKNIDVVFCGFPCQSFSSAGAMKGFDDQKRGTLIFKVIDIVRQTLPKVILLENVAHLVSHNEGQTFKAIISEFRNLGYVTTKDPLILSPFQFKIPQNRKRVFIPMVHRSICENDFLEAEKTSFENAKLRKPKIIENSKSNEKYRVSKEFQNILNAWKEFVNHFNSLKIKMPVIWLDEMIDKKYNSKSKAKDKDWYKNYISTMRTFYKDNRDFIDKWVLKYDPLSWSSRRNRKLEWQAGLNTKFEDTYLQERQSGLRFRRTECFPTLVATVQTPLINQDGYWRRLSPKEVSKLQSFPVNHYICENEFQAYKQYGNSINVEVAEYVIDQYLMKYIKRLADGQ